MNSKNTITFGTRRKKMAFLASKLLLLTCLLLVMSSCHRRKSRGEQAQSTDSPVNSVLNYSCALSPTEGFGILSLKNQAASSEEKDRLLIHATGADPQLGFTVTAPGRYAIYLDLSSPAATLLELFYQVQSQPFSAEHVLQAPLKAGRNQILLSIDDPQFSGGIRLDPGQVAGDYSLYSLQVFSNAPVSFVHPARTQADLSAAFNASTKNLFSAKTSDAWGKIKPLHDAQLIADANGVTVKAAGVDAQLQLPEFELAGNPIVKIVIVSPAATTMEMFYKTGNQLDYDQGHSSSQPLQPGENTVYLEIPVRATSGVLRLDPGMVAGDYLLKEIEARASTPAGSQ
jgi:hypothetical protein